MDRRLTVLIISVTVAITGLLAFVVLPQDSKYDAPSQETAPETARPVSSTINITYDNNGFSPREIIITKGTTVTFDNMTEIPMWVASDPHPAHTDYPELDVIRVNGQYPEPKNDFSFVFDREGIWTYHNHNMPEHTATVIVK